LANKRSLYDYTSDNQSTYSRFSQGTNRTTATALPARANINPLKVTSPLKRKLSDTTIATKPPSPKKIAKHNGTNGSAAAADNSFKQVDIFGSMQVRKSAAKPKAKVNKKTNDTSSKKKETQHKMKFIQKIEDSYTKPN
jgi:hypothetical protein